VTQRFPRGWTVVPDGDTKWSADGACLYGGSPWRMLRLTGPGAALVRDLLAGLPVDDSAAAALARRLVDAGLAHPVPPPDVTVGDIDVVVPAYGRSAHLDECLAALGSDRPVLVVDGT
jgi:mycofactocin glycosyltransferase